MLLGSPIKQKYTILTGHGSRDCKFSPTEPWACWMELDHMDLRADPTCWHVRATLHFLLLKVRGDVIGRKKHRLQVAHIRQGWICKIETKACFFARDNQIFFRRNSIWLWGGEYHFHINLLNKTCKQSTSYDCIYNHSSNAPQINKLM